VDPLFLQEGIISGLIGAIGIAIWFLIADMLQGRPLYTPSVLGTTVVALLQGKGGITSDLPVHVSFGMVMMFSMIHGVTLAAIGALCAWLLHLAESNASYVFNVLLLLVFFAFGFTFLNMVLAGVVLNALSITDILIAHILAVAAMGYYYWNRHPKLVAQL
jgi:hypothetical protein